MTTLIDSLVVGLGLETKEFEKGRKAAGQAFKATGEDARKQAQQIEAHGKQAAQFFTRLRNEALTFFAVFTAGMGFKNFVTDTISGTAALGRMSANLGISTRELDAWQKANERAGGTKGGITAQLQAAQLETAKFKMGMSPSNLAAFGKYGGNFNAYGNPVALLKEYSRILEREYAKSPERAALAAQELGIQEDTYNLLRKGPAAVDGLVQAQLRNAVATEKDAAEADRLRIKLLDLRDTLTATGTRIVLTLAPILEGLVKRLQTIADWIADHREDIAKWVSEAIDAMGKFVVQIDKVVESVGGWKVVLAALVGLKVAGLTAQLLALAGAVTTLGTATKGFALSAAFAGLLKALGIGGALLYSAELGAGEQEELARRRAIGDKGPVKQSSETMQQFRARVGAGSGNVDQVIDSLMAKGWTREQAAGIAANLKKESNFNPGAVGDGGKAYGIAQWHPDRQTDFARWAGKDIRGSTVEEQLAFLDYEMRQGKEKAGGAKVLAATTAAGAAAAMSKYVERPADQIGEMSGRARDAEMLLAANQARGARVARVGAGRGVVNPGNVSSSEVNIGNINIQTQATDAEGIRRDIGPAIQKSGIVVQANSGLT